MSSKPQIIIYWGRRDFRLNDNQALFEGINSHTQNQIPFFPVYILDDNFIKNPGLNVGYYRRYFLARILGQYSHKFDNYSIFTGKPDAIFNELGKHFRIDLYFNDELEPYAKNRDQKVAEIIEQNGGRVYKFRDQSSINLNVLTQTGNIYSVYTPFKNAVIEDFLASKVVPKVDLNNINYKLGSEIDLSTTSGLNFLKLEKTVNARYQQIFDYIDAPDVLTLPNGIAIDISSLCPRQDISSYWYFDEDQALEKLDQFLENDILNYKVYRDDLALDADLDGKTSRISPALKWGLVSARTVITQILFRYPKELIYADSNLLSYVNELIWREFYRYILVHNPKVLDLEFQPKYQNTIKWIQGDEAVNRFKLWVAGQTGYPVVDAAMNQIAKIGWMHNRSRMIVASILTKNLGIDWRWGQAYFRFMLTDLDEASNNGGWQWAASVGSDPKPIRIFNPYLQAQNYDKNEKYQQKWLPGDYNFLEPPIVEHKLARDQALVRYGLVSKSTVKDY